MKGYIIGILQLFVLILIINSASASDLKLIQDDIVKIDIGKFVTAKDQNILRAMLPDKSETPNLTIPDLDINCIGGSLNDGFLWDDSKLKANIKSHCVYYINLSNFDYKNDFKLKDVFVENPIRYYDTNDSKVKIKKTQEFNRYQIAVPYTEEYYVPVTKCIFNEELNESNCLETTITKHKKYGKIINPKDYSNTKATEFLVNIIPDDDFETIEIGIGLGDRDMVTNLTENKYEIGSSLSDSVIYLDPYLYSASVGTPMEPVITTGEHFETNFESAPLEDGLVLGMTFDNGSAFDDSLNGNDGTLYGNTTISSDGGKYGLGGVFDGDGDYIEVGNEDSIYQAIGTTYTVSFWSKPGVQASGDNKGIITKRGSGNYLTITENTVSPGADTSVKMRNSNMQIQYSSGKSQGYWTHWVWSYEIGSSTGSHIYRDGVLLDTQNTIGDPGIINNNSLKIGVEYTSNYFNGSIDEVRIYNRSLNSTEISQLYNNQKMIFENDNFEVQSGRWYVTERSDTQDEWGNDNKAIMSVNDGTGFTTVNNSKFNEYKDKNFTLKFNSNVYSGGNCYLTFNVNGGSLRPRIIFTTNNVLGDGFSGANPPTLTDNKGLTNSREIKIIRQNDKIHLFSDGVYVGYTNQTTLYNLGFGSYNSECIFDDIQIYEHAPEYDSSLVYAMGDEGRNLVEDYNPLNISENGATWNVTDNAYEFDGVNDYVSIDSSVISSQPFTLCFWEYSEPNTEGYFFGDSLDGGNLFLRRYTSGTEVSAGIDDNSIDSFVIPNEQWNSHCFILYSDGTIDWYVNNILKKHDSDVRNFAGLTSNLYIGNRADLTRDFNGSISDVLIFNRSLPASEIADIYDKGRSKYFPTITAEPTEPLKFSTRDYINVNGTAAKSYSASLYTGDHITETISGTFTDSLQDVSFEFDTDNTIGNRDMYAVIDVTDNNNITYSAQSQSIFITGYETERFTIYGDNNRLQIYDDERLVFHKK